MLPTPWHSTAQLCVGSACGAHHRAPGEAKAAPEPAGSSHLHGESHPTPSRVRGGESGGGEDEGGGGVCLAHVCSAGDPSPCCTPFRIAPIPAASVLK